MPVERKARFEDYWRRVFKQKYNMGITLAQYSGGVIFDGLNISLKSGFNAIVGRNGIGKSNVIRSIYNGFVAEESNQLRFKNLVDMGELNVVVEIDAAPTSHKFTPTSITTSPTDIVGLMYDPCILIPSLQNQFLKQNDIEDLLESAGQVIVNEEGLATINFLTNGEYVEVKITNLEDEFPEYPSLPFFQVKTRKASYDCRNMGLGELSLFYFYWLTEQIEKISAKKLIFVEEPESFLPPMTQERLADVLIKVAATFNVAVVLSTHSEHILKRIPRSHIHILQKSTKGVQSICAIENNDHFKTLGLSSPKVGVVFYEDQAAEIFIKSLLKASAKFVPDSFYYHQSESTSGVLKNLQSLKPSLGSFKFVGIFDGDYRASDELNVLKTDNYCFLPTSLAPEKVLLEYVAGLDPDLFSGMLSISDVKLLDAKEVSAGMNHHDYFVVFSTHVEKSFAEVFTLICDAWVKEQVNAPHVEQFLKDFEAILMRQSGMQAGVLKGKTSGVK